jgi:hypothetical protein
MSNTASFEARRIRREASHAEEKKRFKDEMKEFGEKLITYYTNQETTRPKKMLEIERNRLRQLLENATIATENLDDMIYLYSITEDFEKKRSIFKYVKKMKKQVLHKVQKTNAAAGTILSLIP